VNRFVKNNILLISVSAVSAAVVLGLLVFSLIKYVKMAGYVSDIDKLRSEIASLVKKSPAPVDENKPRIEQDIQLFSRTAGILRSHFGRPMEPAVDKFIATLKELPRKDENGEVIQPEPLTKEKFLADFKEGWDQIDGKDYPAKNYFLNSKFRPRYANWNEATKAFAAAAQPFTFEKITSDNVDDILLAAMGIPRALRGNPVELQRIMNDFRSSLVGELDNQIMLTSQAVKFGLPIDTPLAVAKEDYSEIVTHMNIIHDMMTRVKPAGLKVIHNFSIRTGSEGGGMPEGENPDAGQNGGKTVFANSGEKVGDYTIYHYTVEVTGSMDAIREIPKLLDSGYQDRRVYIVRSVFLYAEENGADSLFLPDEVVVAENNNGEGSQIAVQTVRRRRRRGPQVQQEQVEESPEMKEEEERRKREEERKRFEERQAKLPYNERIGYGDVLIGAGNEFRAVIDVDYAVLNR